jgi:hypothetical protein
MMTRIKVLGSAQRENYHHCPLDFRHKKTAKGCPLAEKNGVGDINIPPP